MTNQLFVIDDGASDVPPNANERPFVGENVLVRGEDIAFDSPIKYDGK